MHQTCIRQRWTTGCSGRFTARPGGEPGRYVFRILEIMARWTLICGKRTLPQIAEVRVGETETNEVPNPLINLFWATRRTQQCCSPGGKTVATCRRKFSHLKPSISYNAPVIIGKN